MKIGKLQIGLSMGALLLCMGFGLPQHLHKKVEKELGKVFGSAAYKLEAVLVSESLNGQLPSHMGPDNFFRVFKENDLMGYVFIDQAPSKTAQFDYMVVLDTRLKVIHTKVLIYREEYGGEIGSSRWLKQFLGKQAGDRVDVKTNIDGIAGATISVRSMTTAIDDLLQTIGILHEKQVL